MQSVCFVLIFQFYDTNAILDKFSAPFVMLIVSKYHYSEDSLHCLSEFKCLLAFVISWSAEGC